MNDLHAISFSTLHKWIEKWYYSRIVMALKGVKILYVLKMTTYVVSYTNYVMLSLDV